MRDMELPTESLQRVRDLFVFQTYTCLSYVDLSTFDAEKIEKVKGMKVYIGARAKTSQTFTIPLLKPALAILKKYNNHLPIGIWFSARIFYLMLGIFLPCFAFTIFMLAWFIAR